MGELLQLLEHLIVSGPARNPGELDRLLGLLAQAADRFTKAEQFPAAPPVPAPAPPASGPVAPVFPSQPGGGLQ